MRSALIFLLICGCISAALSIECYDCESLSDPRCNQYFDPEGVKQTDCDDADMPAYLHKYERRIKATGCLTKVHEGVADRRDVAVISVIRRMLMKPVKPQIRTCHGLI
ncbi:uncharacterized protein LOC118741401 [Rhagoletis pomonella]|uniref:uncharacterized protein LOC118741401 n=1 Tax=Rhagoletis pomonella TaxID=28610 RepID=UPI0017826CDD|nr:uncharacterized protein LOC118741401 [Rhagoletis pomonella]